MSFSRTIKYLYRKTGVIMPIGNDKTTLSVYLDKELRDFVRGKAELDGRSASNFVNWMLEEFRAGRLVHTHRPLAHQELSLTANQNN